MTTAAKGVAAYASKGLATDPEARADITKRREAGESLAAIGRTYDVSRERIRQLCDKWGVQAPKKKESTALKAVELVKNFAVESLTEAARQGGCCADALKRELRRQGFDLEQVKADLTAHRYDGQTWGDWSAIDGGYIYKDQNHRWVMCRCTCGTERRVAVNNLLNKVSRGCGCRTASDRRRRVPWVCTETGERFENTMGLAKHLGLNQLLLYRRLHRGEPYIDAQGRQWNALPEEATLHRPDADHLAKMTSIQGRPVVCVETGEQWRSGAGAAEALGINPQTFRDAIRRNGSYSVNGRTYKLAEEVAA